MSGAIDWLVFDLGGVLVDVACAEVTLSDLASRTGTPRDRLDEVLRERFTEQPFSLAEQFQTGLLDEHAFHAALNNELERPMSFDALKGALETMLEGDQPDTVALLSRLASVHRIACYSNTNATHWRHLQAHFSFFAHIERAFASQELGYAKPDRRGFDAVVARLASAPARCLLIDDRAVNIDGARAAGWQALLFTDAATLERDLTRLGVAVPVAP
ncbi:HAD-IA family hydrolase [Salinisphaera aquimarina]|uniref:HAD-IA family hydrolase n=1 Tax=Salinisphaera aquimarina TaxID=2094031 RepID=A0ABV7ETY9_9GAMM